MTAQKGWSRITAARSQLWVAMSRPLWSWAASSHSKGNNGDSVGGDGSARIVDRTSERRIGARESRTVTGGRLSCSILPGGASPGSIRGDLIPKDSVGTFLLVLGESGSTFLPASGESGSVRVGTFLPASGESGSTFLPASGKSGSVRGGLLPKDSVGTVLPVLGEPGSTFLPASGESGSVCWLGSSCALPVRAVLVWILEMMGQAGLAHGGIWTCAAP